LSNSPTCDRSWNIYQYLTIKAWDLGRSISLCRWGYNVGFITEDEAWARIFRIARIIQPLYRSWEGYGMIFCVDDSGSSNLSFYRFLIAVDGTFLNYEPVYKILSIILKSSPRLPFP